MVAESFQVSTYMYYNWSSRGKGKTNLVLKGSGGESCSAWFYEDDNASLPKATKIADGSYKFYYHHSQLEHLIDMLRHEKPIYVYFNDNGGWNNSRISTSYEPVGEGQES